MHLLICICCIHIEYIIHLGASCGLGEDETCLVLMYCIESDHICYTYVYIEDVRSQIFASCCMETQVIGTPDSICEQDCLLNLYVGKSFLLPVCMEMQCLFVVTILFQYAGSFYALCLVARPGFWMRCSSDHDSISCDSVRLRTMHAPCVHHPI